MRRRWLLGGVLGLAGCGLSERAYLEKRDWPLAVARPDGVRPEGARGARGGRVLLLRTVQAGPGLETRGLRSLQPDGSVRTDFYEAWSVPPAEGAEAALRQWLAASGRFGAVLAPGSRMTPDWILEATLTALVADPANGVARAAMSVVVLDQRGGSPRVLAQRMLDGDAPLGGTAPAALVAAMSAALRQVLEQVDQMLAGLA